MGVMATVQSVCEGGGKGDAVSFHHEIHILVDAPEEEVAHHPADQVNGYSLGVRHTPGGGE